MAGSRQNWLTFIMIMIIIIVYEIYEQPIISIKEKQMVDKYNESSQLRVRLAILESQLKRANNRIKHLENTNKDESSRTKPSQVK